MRIGRLILTLIFSVGSVAWGSASDRIVFVRVDPYEKIMIEQKEFVAVDDTVDVALDEVASFQFAVRSSLKLTDLHVSVSYEFPHADRSALDYRCGFVGYVKASLPLPKPPADVVESVSGFYPDPIYELESIDVEANRTQPVWLSVGVGLDARAGIHTAHLIISGRADGKHFRHSLPVALNVYPVRLQQRLSVSNWWYMSPKQIDYLNTETDTVELYSERYWTMIGELAERMKECRQNTVDISPIGHTDCREVDGTYTFDFTNFDRMVELFDSYGVASRIEGSPLGTRLGNWESDFGLRVPERDSTDRPIRVLYPLNDPKVEQFYSQFMPALTQHLNERGYWSRYVQHIADEPIDANAESYCKVAAFVKSYSPDLRIMEAVLTTKVADAVDVLVPQLDVYANNYDFFTTRRQNGKQVWFYTCMVPQGEYANRFIELPLIKTHLLHWINFRYGAVGYLHWGFNSWRGETVKQADGRHYLVETSERIAQNGGTLPAGDFALVYPLDGKVYGSIRLQAMRDGVDDYALLSMLAEKDKELADSLCRTVIRDWTDYQTDPALLRKIRHRILTVLSVGQDESPTDKRFLQ